MWFTLFHLDSCYCMEYEFDNPWCPKHGALGRSLRVALKVIALVVIVIWIVVTLIVVKGWL